MLWAMDMKCGALVSDAFHPQECVSSVEPRRLLRLAKPQANTMA